MSESNLVQQLSNKESDKEELARQVVQQPSLLSDVFDGLKSDKASIKYGCDKILRIISEKQPSFLYSHMDFFLANLEHENNFLKWGAIHIISNLAAVDSESKIEQYLDKYFAPIPGPVLTTATNVLKGAAKIALAKPQLTHRVTQELLKVETAKYKTEECRNIALGQTITAFGQFFDLIEDKEPVIQLV